MNIKNDLGNAVAKSVSVNHWVFVPLNIQPGIPLHFVANNIDFKDGTTGGKSEFHGTTLVVFPKKQQARQWMLKIRRTNSFTFQHIPF